jgi:hypothetical protein
MNVRALVADPLARPRSAVGAQQHVEQVGGIGRVHQSLVDHRVDRAVKRQRDVLDVAQGWRQAHAGEGQSVQCVVGRTGHEAPQSEPLQPLRVPQSPRRQVAHALHQRPEVLAEQGIGDYAQGCLDHRVVHVESRTGAQRVGDVNDRVGHQFDDAVEMAPGEGRVEHSAVGGPGIALVGEQVDAGGGADGLVFVGLDVFQPGLVQHVIDIVGMADGNETSSCAAESGDVAAA